MMHKMSAAAFKDIWLAPDYTDTQIVCVCQITNFLLISQTAETHKRYNSLAVIIVHLIDE